MDFRWFLDVSPDQIFVILVLKFSEDFFFVLFRVVGDFPMSKVGPNPYSKVDPNT